MVPGASHLTCYPPDLLPLSPSLTPLLSIVNIQQIGLLLTGHFARSMLFFFLSFFVLVIISIIILFLKEKKKRTRYKWNTPLLTCKQRRLLRYLYFAVPKKTRWKDPQDTHELIILFFSHLESFILSTLSRGKVDSHKSLVYTKQFNYEFEIAIAQWSIRAKPERNITRGNRERII